MYVTFITNNNLSTMRYDSHNETYHINYKSTVHLNFESQYHWHNSAFPCVFKSNDNNKCDT